MANLPIRNLLSLIQKRCLKTYATLSPTNHALPSSSSFTVEYLVNSCGLSLQSALSASKKLQLHENNLQKHQSVLEFLKSHNFNDTHIAELIQKLPRVLQCKIENNLKPRFDFLITNGFAGQFLPELVLSNTEILKSSLDSQIKPSLEILKSVLDSNEKIVMAMKRSSWLLTFNLKNTMQPNVDFLIKQGVNVNAVTHLILKQPRAIMQKHDRMVYAVNTVKNLGLDPKAFNFVEAVRIVLSMSESTLMAKIEVMKSLGWTEEEIWLLFKKFPHFLGSSEERIRIAMDFYMNTLKLERKNIIAYPILLGYAIDKRIRPRYNVFKALKSKNLIKKNVKIERLLIKSEDYFLENYVNKYVDKVAGLLEIYKGTNNTRKIHDGK